MLPKHHCKISYFCFLFFCLLASHAIYAVETVILVANSSHFSLLHRIETAIYAQKGTRPQLVRLEAEDLVDARQLESYCAHPCHLVVAVGSQATKAVLETNTKFPILSILIRKHAFDDLIDHHIQTHGGKPNITAIYLDQPFKRQMNLILDILPASNKQATIGVLLGPTSKRYRPILEEKVKNYPFKLHIITVQNQENAISALDVLLEEVDLIWAIPDSTVFNSRTARGLLLSAYRKHVPFIGFSRTYASHGALAAVYSNPKQIANQTAEHIMTLLKDDNLEKATSIFPDTFSIATNTQVVRSIGLDIESEASLDYRLKLQECEQTDKVDCQQTILHELQPPKEHDQ